MKLNSLFLLAATAFAFGDAARDAEKESIDFDTLVLPTYGECPANAPQSVTVLNAVCFLRFENVELCLVP
jgi:hypothetical protein